MLHMITSQLNLLKLSDWHTCYFTFHLDVGLLHDVTKLLHGIHHEIFAGVLVL